MSKHLFPLGDIVITPGAGEVFRMRDPLPYVERHVSGDWGNVGKEDAAENDLSVREGFRILSSYKVDGVTVWIITEADRSVTTLLLPREY